MRCAFEPENIGAFKKHLQMKLTYEGSAQVGGERTTTRTVVVPVHAWPGGPGP
jgi:hypothetical protein